jgi:lipid A 4'-phosphatase
MKLPSQKHRGENKAGPYSMADGNEIARVAMIAVWIALLTTTVFSLMPQIDIAVSRFFMDSDGGFVVDHSPFWRATRRATLNFYTIWYIAIVVAGIWAWFTKSPALGLTWPKWLYLALCSIAGPLLVTNIVLKEEWGRWRPREVIDLGGSENFTSPLDLSGTCNSNCSFVSGEVSSMVMVFIALAFMTTRLRPVFYILTAVMGGFVAFLRIGQGGHFLSDTLFAAALMMLIAAALYRLMFLGKKPLATESGFDWKRLSAGFGRLTAYLGAAGHALIERIGPRK